MITVVRNDGAVAPPTSVAVPSAPVKKIRTAWQIPSPTNPLPSASNCVPAGPEGGRTRTRGGAGATPSAGVRLISQPGCCLGNPVTVNEAVALFTPPSQKGSWGWGTSWNARIVPGPRAAPSGIVTVTLKVALPGMLARPVIVRATSLNAMEIPQRVANPLPDTTACV